MTRPEGWRRVWPALPAIVVLAMGAGAGPLPSPDGVEMAAAGRCLWHLPLDPEACLGLEPWFWPPAFPLISGALALVVDPALAALLVGLAAFGALALPVAELGRRLAGPGAGVLAALALAATPALRTHALMGEARGLALLAIFSAAAALSRRRLSGSALAAAGLALGLAMLTREEAAGAAALLSVLALARFGRRGALVPVVAALCVAPLVAVLSARAGRLVPTPRAWQGPAVRWVEAWPREWVFWELSAGTRGSPLRGALSQADAAAQRAPFDLDRSLDFLLHALQQGIPLAVAVVAAAGAVWVAVRGARSSAPWGAAAASAAAAPYLAVGLLPEAQDAMVPVNNLLPVVILATLFAAAGVAAAARRLHAAWGVPAAAALALTSPVMAAAHRLGEPPDGPRAFEAAAAWLDEAEPIEPVAASLATAPPVLRAGHRRVRLPPPPSVAASLASWQRPQRALISNLDLPAARLTLRVMLEAGAWPEAWLAHGTDSVVVWRLPPPKGGAP